MKKQLMMIVALAAVGAAGAQVPKPVWELGRDPIDPAATVGDVRIVDGVVKLDCGNAFALPPDVLGDQKDYTIEIEFRRGAAFQNLPRMEGALKLLSNRDPDAKAGMSLIYFPPGWDRNGGIGNVVGLEVNTYWNGETGGLAGNDFNTYSLVVKDREASLHRNGMLLAMTGAIRPSRRPLALGGAGWRGTARYGVASGPVPAPYELRALRIYDVALAPHCPLGPIALAACLQLDACSPNAVIQEQSLGIHYNVGNDVLDYLADPGVFAYADGYVALPDKPGLGIEIAEEKVRELARIGHSWKNPVWRQADGSVAEW